MDTVYSVQNAWIRLDGRKATIGLLGSAVNGDVVYIELPAIGLHFNKGERCATVESTKTVSEIYAPVSGVVLTVNDHVYDEPDAVKQEGTWLFTLDVEGKVDTNGWTIKT